MKLLSSCILLTIALSCYAHRPEPNHIIKILQEEIETLETKINQLDTENNNLNNALSTCHAQLEKLQYNKPLINEENAHTSNNLEERLKQCEEAELHLHELETELQQKQAELRACEQLSGPAKLGAGAAGLSQLRLIDTGNNPTGIQTILITSLKEAGFILFKEAAKESIPNKPIIEWNGYSLLNTHELTEITAEELKAYAHNRSPKDLAFLSAQLYIRVKIMDALDHYGLTKPIDKLEHHSRIVIRGLLCKGVDYALKQTLNRWRTIQK